MTPQEVILEFQWYLDMPDEADISREAVELAIAALEKQIPKKPYMQQVVINHYEQDCMECPNCDSFLGYAFECKEEHYQDNYCKHCGQKLDWRE